MHVRTKLAVMAVAVITILSFSPPQGDAQAIPTAYKRGDIDAFFTYGRSNTDFGPTRNNVYTFGGDFMIRPFGPVQPGVNVRYVHSSGAVVDEPFFGGGIDLRFRQIWRLRPYAVGDIGVGSVKEKRVGGINDSGTSYILGGGVDVPITNKIAARGEFDYQHISISSGGNGPNLSFTPYSANIGIVYRIR